MNMKCDKMIRVRRCVMTKRIFKKRSKKSGLPPGTLVHVGERTAGTVEISAISYDKANFHEIKRVNSIEECVRLDNTAAVTWINIEGIHQTEVIQKIGDCYGFHPLVLEDILNTDQRPKMEDYKDYTFIVLKMLHDSAPEIIAEQVSMILGRNFVISFLEGIRGDVFKSTRERIRSGKGRLREMKADYLAYSLIDAVVDNYFVILEKMGERIEDLEEELLSNPTTGTVHVIHQLKREMIFLRKAVWPLREVINTLVRGDSSLISDSTRTYLRDVYDHTIQVIDSVETFRDMLSGMLDIYLSSISNRLNEIMKFLTIIGTIFIPLTFITGIYGMNFEYIPELKWKWGYFGVLTLMLGIGIFLLFYFKKKKWL
jgi:magnesium transporter